MHPIEPDPRDTVRIIDQLVKRRLIDEVKFKRMHHLGGSLSTFQKYCSTINSFQRNSQNRRLHEELRALLESHSR